MLSRNKRGSRTKVLLTRNAHDLTATWENPPPMNMRSPRDRGLQPFPAAVVTLKRPVSAFR